MYILTLLPENCCTVNTLFISALNRVYVCSVLVQARSLAMADNCYLEAATATGILDAEVVLVMLRDLLVF